ncbi:hypothetical protein PPERSA_12436 [Pseudocohnilembus persalinus]|uniref:Enkurin domain-containing protein n=1 Tax=Pseudocohnilembus persalinus TaxID=266149 RepID=A0A0V0QPT8_PSEPJ|nr:hypothetical protein PPERSA_12436 [Pseudocohnilembus persalinus]|eukprot:KRX03989.1 hypothetical protein PPERSA_12436 [Pseudocohnilembus persalinus]
MQKQPQSNQNDLQKQSNYQHNSQFHNFLHHNQQYEPQMNKFNDDSIQNTPDISAILENYNNPPNPTKIQQMNQELGYQQQQQQDLNQNYQKEIGNNDDNNYNNEHNIQLNQQKQNGDTQNLYKQNQEFQETRESQRNLQNLEQQLKQQQEKLKQMQNTNFQQFENIQNQNNQFNVQQEKQKQQSKIYENKILDNLDLDYYDSKKQINYIHGDENEKEQNGEQEGDYGQKENHHKQTYSEVDYNDYLNGHQNKLNKDNNSQPQRYQQNTPQNSKREKEREQQKILQQAWQEQIAEKRKLNYQNTPQAKINSLTPYDPYKAENKMMHVSPGEKLQRLENQLSQACQKKSEIENLIYKIPTKPNAEQRKRQVRLEQELDETVKHISDLRKEIKYKI